MPIAPRWPSCAKRIAEDEAPDENGVMQTRTVLKLHPRLAPIKAAVFPLVKKDGMPEIAQEIYAALKPHCRSSTTRKGRSGDAIAGRMRPARRTASPSTARRSTDRTVTIRDRDTLKQWRVKVDDCVPELLKLLR